MGTCCSKLFWDAASSRIPHGSLVKQLSSDLTALDKTAYDEWSHPQTKPQGCFYETWVARPMRDPANKIGTWGFSADEER